MNQQQVITEEQTIQLFKDIYSLQMLNNLVYCHQITALNMNQSLWIYRIHAPLSSCSCIYSMFHIHNRIMKCYKYQIQSISVHFKSQNINLQELVINNQQKKFVKDASS